MLAHRNRTAALATALAGLVAVLVAWVAVGAHGPLSALLGAALVLVFFGAGSLPFVVAGDGRGGRSALAFLVLLMTYVLRILLGVAVYAVASEAEGVDTTVVGLTVIGCALVWTNTQVVLGLSRRHRPTLDV
ncbi:MAG: synthase [Frankiales bacterium]|jgi:ATP synthase protein I|nr:synthase [Frankiales bacterium]